MEQDYRPPPTLLSSVAASSELLDVITSFLNLSSVCSLECCCKALYELNYYYWYQRLCVETSGSGDGNGGSGNGDDEDDGKPVCNLRHEGGFVSCYNAYKRPLLRRGCSPLPINIPDMRQAKHVLQDLSAAIKRGTQNIAVRVVSCSSIDREQEQPSNCLAVSPCFVAFHSSLRGAPFTLAAPRAVQLQSIGLNAQSRCLCTSAQSCYWSSASCRVQNGTEHITIQTVPQMAVCTGFSITPYCAFFQPGAPVYSPLTVHLQFLCDREGGARAADGCAAVIGRIRDLGGRLGDELEEELLCIYHTTEPVGVQQSFEEQTFLLAAPVLVPARTLVRFVLYGHASMQSMAGFDEDGPEEDGYFTCISNLKLLGGPLIMASLSEGVASGGAALSLRPNPPVPAAAGVEISASDTEVEQWTDIAMELAETWSSACQSALQAQLLGMV